MGGSGPTDLDGTLGPNKPYRDIAWGLASTDQASSLRYTKRNAVCDVDPVTITIDDEYTDDALAAIQRLRSAEGADPNRTVVVGHSLGAKLAPRVAARADGVAGVVLLAPPGRSLFDLIVEQTRYIAELDGTVDETEQQRIGSLESAASRIAELDIDDGELLLGAGRAYWESLREYDAVATARSLDVPILVCHGGRDYQVTETDIQVWRDGLAGRADVTFQTYPALNHLFMPGEGQSRPEEYTTSNHVAEQVITDLGGWLSARWQG
jgi:dienelactone hydrolase